MRILLVFSFFLYFNLSGYGYISGSTGITISPNSDKIKKDLETPFHSSLYDSLEAIELDENTDSNETLPNRIFVVKKTKFRINLIIPILKTILSIPNLITFGTDTSPPVSCI